MSQNTSRDYSHQKFCTKHYSANAWNKQRCCPAQEIYAEWVGAEAKLALLEAHAQCRAFVAGLPDEATHSSVMNAQKSHARLADCCKSHTISLCAQG